jgi:tetratricopeptide (TPR) repeat protein
MIIKEKNVQEIEAKLKSVGGDMIKIEYLENCLKTNLPNDARRFCFISLAKIYEAKKMLQEAGKNADLAGDLATTYKDKLALFMESVKIWTRYGNYQKSDEIFQKALACANPSEKEFVKAKYKQELFLVAGIYEKENKNTHAVKTYEKLKSLTFITPEELAQINKKLIPLYTRVGKIREAMQLEHAK